MPLRLVIDTNILISTLLFPTETFIRIRRGWEARTIIPIVSDDTIAEFRRVLAYSKFGLPVNRQINLLLYYLNWCERVIVPDDIDVPECRDPSDIPFLELALAGRADALVTGDSDLLALAPMFAIPIITPSELRELAADITS